jgi:carbon storage regulator
VLTLSRRKGEAVVIGADVVVTVVRSARGQVQLSIAAPRDVPILRGELLRRRAQTPAGAAGKGESSA